MNILEDWVNIFRLLTEKLACAAGLIVVLNLFDWIWLYSSNWAVWIQVFLAVVLLWLVAVLIGNYIKPHDWESDDWESDLLFCGAVLPVACYWKQWYVASFWSLSIVILLGIVISIIRYFRLPDS